MKLLTVAIPCYNSAEYMEHSIETLLSGGDELEIIIVDDGSAKDNTAKIADEYAVKYPEIIKAIHQENGGHGEAVNTGLKNATGVYYKVVDSDDWVSRKALKKVLDTIRNVVKNNQDMDLLIANYVYDKVGEKRKKVMKYTSVLPQNRIFEWEDIGRFKPSQYILMHSVIYKTEVLKKCRLKLPKHTFYVDNIFVYQPLPSVKTIYYMDVNLYHYFIGREDQSVNESVIIKRIDQQIRVTKQMIENCKIEEVESKKLRKYMVNYMSMMMTVCTVYLYKSGVKENLIKKKELWKYFKDTDPYLYKKVRKSVLGIGMNIPGVIGRKIVIGGYKISKKIYKFG